MKRLSIAIAFFLSLPGAAFAQGGMGPGPGMVHSTGGGGGGGYTGPGDVSPGATGWWGMRAYSAAQAAATANVADLVSQGSGLAVCTLKLATSGDLDMVGTYCGGLTVAAACAAAAGGSCKITKMYDQSGNGHDMTRAFATAPAFVVVTTGLYLAAIQFGGGTQLNNAAMTTAQPHSVVAALKFPSHGAIQGIVTGSSYEYSINLTPALRIKANTISVSTLTLTDNTWYATMGIFQGTSNQSQAHVNASVTTGLNSGTNTMPAAITIGSSSFSEHFLGLMTEVGVWPSNISGASPISNIQTYGGF